MYCSLLVYKDTLRFDYESLTIQSVLVKMFLASIFSVIKYSELFNISSLRESEHIKAIDKNSFAKTIGRDTC